MAEVEEVESKKEARISETTEEVQKLSVEDRAVRFFKDEARKEGLKAEQRKLQMEEVARKDPRDPNLASDRDFIDMRTALQRGYEDAARACQRRSDESRRKIEAAKKAGDAALAAAMK